MYICQKIISLGDIFPLRNINMNYLKLNDRLIFDYIDVKPIYSFHIF